MPPEIIYQHQFDVIASSELNTFVGHDDPDVQQEDMLIMMTMVKSLKVDTKATKLKKKIYFFFSKPL